MGYDDNPRMVRVDFFKPSGKWYSTEAIKWLSYDETQIHDAFREALRAELGGRLSEMTAVCLHPYHVNEHPLMIKVW